MPKEHETSKETIKPNELRLIGPHECMHKDDDYSYKSLGNEFKQRLEANP